MRHAHRFLLSLLLLAGVAGCDSETTEPAADDRTEVAEPAAELPAASPEDVDPPPPVVGVTGYVIMPGERGDDGRGQFQLTRAYWERLQEAGAQVVHLVPTQNGDVGALLDRVDALVLAGGPDIDPAAYGEEQHETVSPLNPERQEFDFALAREAMERQMPILGICLGSQELNVVRGGSLVQDVPTEVGDEVGHRQVELDELRRGVHPIEILPDTPLARLYGTDRIEVNSAHHQASDELGEGLVVAARAPDGVVEAFYDPEMPFLVGVQFHPELQRTPEGLHDGLWEALVEAASEHARKRAPATRAGGQLATAR